jgi:hypothetical protein
MGWQPGPGGGTGTDPDRGPGGGAPARDPRLELFAGDGLDGGPAPSGALALLADELSGPARRCPGATGNELTGLLRAWAAVESWAAGAKLGVIAELFRRDEVPPGTGYHGDLPDAWSPSLRHQLAAVLSCSAQSAETTAWLAWEQQARLPGTGALLGDGTLTYAKARAVTETFRYLSDAGAARAEALILDQLAGKTYPQVLRLAGQAALTVDPELAERRREQAQRNDARVMLFREQQGTAGLSGRDLPPDEALAAMASVNARAQDYEDCGAFGDTPMDVLRSCAYLDLLNGVTPEMRIACAEARDEAVDAAEALAWAEARAAGTAEEAPARTGAPAGTGPGAEDEPRAGTAPAPDAGTPGRADDRPGDDDGGGADDRADPRGDCDGPASHGTDAGERSGDPAVGCRRPDGDDDEPGDDDADPDDDDGGGGDRGPGGHGPDSPACGPGVRAAGRALQQHPPDLVVPLATLLGLAERPGEIHRLGPVDPALARRLAAAAAASPSTLVCVTVTSPEGYATGHGCAREQRARTRAREPRTAPPGTAPAGIPARLNLTIPATVLPGLASRTSHDSPWSLTPRGSPGPPDTTGPPDRAGPPDGAGLPDKTGPPDRANPADGTSPADGYGTWTLTTPGGRQFTVRLDPVPTYECDHRYETRAYQPGDKLRHLVQVRDGACTFPPCSRHARESDFEHAQPYDQGGKTCTCNAGARSRACHRVKQSKGWQVTQPKPGWHQWQTPAGRVYVQEPWRYPA